MNQKELEKERNKNARKIVNSDSRHRNYVNLHPQNSKKHEMKKVELCWQLEQQDKEYITEARFKDIDLRADIYVLDDDEIWEIETSKNELQDRKDKYPHDTWIYPLWTDKIEVELLDNL